LKNGLIKPYPLKIKTYLMLPIASFIYTRIQRIISGHVVINYLLKLPQRAKKFSRLNQEMPVWVM